MISDTPFDSATAKRGSAGCPAGKVVLGGGGLIITTDADPNANIAPITLKNSGPYLMGDGWFADGLENGSYSFDWAIRVIAICAKVATTTVAAANETAAAVATPVPPVSADGDQAPAPVTVTEPTTTTSGAQTMFLPIVTQ